MRAVVPHVIYTDEEGNKIRDILPDREPSARDRIRELHPGSSYAFEIVECPIIRKISGIQRPPIIKDGPLRNHVFLSGRFTQARKQIRSYF